MNRATRKANLRKLQLAGASNEDPSKPASTTPKKSISAYFSTPNKRRGKNAKERESHGEIGHDAAISADLDLPINAAQNCNTSSGDEKKAFSALGSPAAKRSKSTKLTNFLGENKSSLPRPRESDVFEKSAQRTKKAPKGKAAAVRKVRSKRQPNIKSAFLRNEEMFSEITAQHCIADNFSPDDMQLALAISQSEAEKSGIQQTSADKVVDLVEAEDASDCLRNKLQKYGFRLAPREDYNAIATAFLPGAQKGKRTKWANKFTALTLRNPEIQMKKLNEKIGAFLGGQFQRHPANEASNSAPLYSVSSPTLRKIHVVNDAKIISHTNLNLLTTKLEDFFVRDLFDVSRLGAGHLLKDWAAIQGRDVSPRLRSKRMQSQQEKLTSAYRDLEQYYQELNMADCVSEPAKHKIEPKHAASSSDILKKQPHLPTDDTGTFSMEDAFRLKETDEPLKLVGSSQVEELNRSRGSLPASPLREPPDKKLRLGASLELREEAENPHKNTLALTLLSLIHELTDTASLSSGVQADVSATSTSACSFATQRARAPSPDLFADSDADISIDNGNKSSEPEAEAHSITTYEIYTSDEVKTSCSADEMRSTSYPEYLNLERNKDIIIDLTQENMSAKSPLSTKTQNDYDDLPNCKPSRRSNHTEVTPKSITDDVLDKLLRKYQPYQQASSHLQNPRSSRRGQSKSLGFPRIGRTGSSENLTLNFESNALLFSHRRYKSDNFPTQAKLTENFLDFTQIDEPLFSRRRYESDHLSSRAKPPDDYLDLTQSDPEEGDDNEIMILSDDEINYSIRKASTTNKLGDDADASDDLRDLSLSTDSEHLPERYRQSGAAFSPKDQSPCKQADFSLLDLIDVDKSFNRTPAIKQKDFQKSASTLSFDGVDDFEPIYSQFLTTPSKLEHFRPAQNTPSAKVNLLNGHTELGALDGYAELRRSLFQERAEFGILESHSEPFTQSPFKTPVKTTNDSFHFEWGEASFLESPSERPSFVKRHSRNRSSKRFDSLLKSAEILLNNDDDFDEFDRLVYGSPEPKSSSKCNAPAGLSQLLTAEISFRDEFETDIERTPAVSAQGHALNGSSTLSSKPCTLARRSTENLSELPQEMEVNGKVYTVRLDRRPKPDFTQQSEAELLKQLYNFGIKPLKRKQAVKMLEFIYNQTHPILLDGAQKAAPAEAQASIVSHPEEAAGTSSRPVFEGAATSTTQVATLQNAVDSKKLNLHDATGDAMLRFTEDLCAEFDDEFYIFQTNISKKISQPLLPLHVAWFNLVCCNPELHETILMYEPIDLQEIYLFFKSLGYRYDPKEMKAFFDSRCIIFRYDLAPPGRPNENNRHVRKPRQRKAH